jgi:hypothetical protein
LDQEKNTRRHNMNTRLVRVFISSTFRDFIEERDELVKKVFPELRRRCKDRFVEVLEVDLRWGITEEQSKSGGTLRICLEEIERCRPSAPVFFIGLLGERYGWIPEPDFYTPDVLEDTSLAWVKDHVGGMSVTELEIRHGVLRNPAMRKRAFFYFRQDGYQKRHWTEIHEAYPQLLPSDFTNERERDPAASDRKQAALKRSIQDASPEWEPRKYEIPADVGNLVLEDLWQAINAIFPVTTVPDEVERHRIEHAVFGQSRTKNYVLRDGLFEELDLVFTDQNQPTRVVTGESGVGKSALLAAWINRLDNLKPHRRFVHYIGATPSSSTAESIIRSLLAAIRSWGSVADPLPEDFADALRILPDWLRRAAEGNDGGVLLILDALDQLELKQDRSLYWLPAELPPGVRLIVSTLPGECEGELQRRGWLTGGINVPLFTAGERTRVIETYMGRIGKKLDVNLVKRLAAAPQAANPLFLRVVLDELRIRASYEGLDLMLNSMLDSNNPTELFVKVLHNLEEFNNQRPNLVGEALSYLAIARRSLTENEILQLLSSHSEPSLNPLPRHYWSPLYLALEDSLVSRNGQLVFFHQFLRTAVEKKYLSESSNLTKIHDRLSQLAEFWKSHLFSPSLLEYGLQYGPLHLRMAGKIDCLADLALGNGFRQLQIKTLRGTGWTRDLFLQAIKSRVLLDYSDNKEWNRTVEIVRSAKEFITESESGGREELFSWLSTEQDTDVKLEKILQILSVLRPLPRFLAFVALFWKVAIEDSRDNHFRIDAITRAYQTIDRRHREWSRWIDQRLMAWLAIRLNEKCPNIDFLKVFSTAAQGRDESMLRTAQTFCINGTVLEDSLNCSSEKSISAKEIDEEVRFLCDANRAIHPDEDSSKLLELAEKSIRIPAEDLIKIPFQNTVSRIKNLLKPNCDEVLLKLASTALLIKLPDADQAFEMALKAAQRRDRYYWRSKELERIACILTRTRHLNRALEVAGEVRDPTFETKALLLIQLDRPKDAFDYFLKAYISSDLSEDSSVEISEKCSPSVVNSLPSPDPTDLAEANLQRARGTRGTFSSELPERLTEVALNHASNLASISAEDLLREAWAAIAANDPYELRSLLRIASAACHLGFYAFAQEIEEKALALCESAESFSGRAESLGCLLSERGYAMDRTEFKQRALSMMDAFTAELAHGGNPVPDLDHAFCDLINSLASLSEWDRLIAALGAYSQIAEETPDHLDHFLHHLKYVGYGENGRLIIRRVTEIFQTFPRTAARQRILVQLSLVSGEYRQAYNAASAIPDRYWRDREVSMLVNQIARSGRWRDAIRLHPWSWMKDNLEKYSVFEAIADAAITEDIEQGIRYCLRALSFRTSNLDSHDLSIQNDSLKRLLKSISERCDSYGKIRRLLNAMPDPELREICIEAFLTQPTPLDRFSLHQILRWLPIKSKHLKIWYDAVSK